jgi:hypothetical protein
MMSRGSIGCVVLIGAGTTARSGAFFAGGGTGGLCIVTAGSAMRAVR